MVIAVFFLAAASLYVQRTKKELFYFSWKHIPIGIGTAVLLYLIFFIGNLLAGFILPSADQNLGSIYALKDGHAPLFVGLLIFLIIGPGEEIFWRGFIQYELGNAFGNVGGVIASSALYSLVHVWALNPLLLGAAFVAGLFWGSMFLKYKSVWPLMISHAVWDVLVFLVLPFS